MLVNGPTRTWCIIRHEIKCFINKCTAHSEVMQKTRDVNQQKQCINQPSAPNLQRVLLAEQVIQVQVLVFWQWLIKYMFKMSCSTLFSLLHHNHNKCFSLCLDFGLWICIVYILTAVFTNCGASSVVLCLGSVNPRTKAGTINTSAFQNKQKNKTSTSPMFRLSS